MNLEIWADILDLVSRAAEHASRQDNRKNRMSFQRITQIARESLQKMKCSWHSIKLNCVSMKAFTQVGRRRYLFLIWAPSDDRSTATSMKINRENHSARARHLHVREKIRSAQPLRFVSLDSVGCTPFLIQQSSRFGKIS